MKKGFTLIELLAVIVILAIIAIIATPIVLNIIRDSKENSQLRSAEMYIKSVETSVATSTLKNKKLSNGNYDILEDGNICVEYNADKCINELKVEMNGEKPNGGSVTFTSGKIDDIELTYTNGKTIGKDTKGDLVYLKKFKDICKYANNGVTEKTAGAKYTCEVKPGTSYTFYVLSTPAEGATSINLIMDRNINSDGTPAGMTGVTQSTNATQYNLVSWISNLDYGCDETDCAKNNKGPITAMKFLYNATKDWTSVEPINYIYNDRETQKITDDDMGYTSFVSINGVATITSLSEETVTIGSKKQPLRARMPIYTKDTKNELFLESSNSYLYENLSVESMYGYWTLSSYNIDVSKVWYVYSYGYINNTKVYYNNFNGVRPVITLKL